jgi:hypothetical protein
MDMVVMPVVVTVGVIVLERLVHVLMSVLLGQMKPEADDHRRRRSAGEERGRLTKGERESRAPERP